MLTQHYLSFFEKNMGDYIFTVLQLLSITNDFSSKFQSSMQSFITSCRQEKVAFWPMDELNHHQ